MHLETPTLVYIWWAPFLMNHIWKVNNKKDNVSSTIYFPLRSQHGRRNMQITNRLFSAAQLYPIEAQTRLSMDCNTQIPFQASVYTVYIAFQSHSKLSVLCQSLVEGHDRTPSLHQPEVDKKAKCILQRAWPLNQKRDTNCLLSRTSPGSQPILLTISTTYKQMGQDISPKARYTPHPDPNIPHIHYPPDCVKILMKSKHTVHHLFARANYHRLHPGHNHLTARYVNRNYEYDKTVLFNKHHWASGLSERDQAINFLPEKTNMEAPLADIYSWWVLSKSFNTGTHTNTLPNVNNCTLKHSNASGTAYLVLSFDEMHLAGTI